MPNLESLLNDLANLDAQHDLDGIRKVREQIISEHSESDAAVEAQYKLGLDFLFRQRDIMAAVEAFAAAAGRKHPYWSAAARTSLGLCYYHQKRLQKALFELRRVAYPETPNLHSITALAFLENIFAEEGKPDEVEKARRERIKQLEQLIAHNHETKGDPQERGHLLHQLGLAYRDLGEDAKGKGALEEAKLLGPDVLGAELYRAIVDAES